MGSAVLEAREWHAARRSQEPSPLAAEAAQQLSSRPLIALALGRTESAVLQRTAAIGAQYTVKAGETAADLARSTLNIRGVMRPDQNSIYDEMQRIATMNGVAIQQIRPGMTLRGLPSGFQPVHYQESVFEPVRPVPNALHVNGSGQHVAGRHESLRSIAYNALRLRGAPHNTETQIWQEMSRIAYRNSDAYPQLMVNPRLLKPGMLLTIADSRLGPAADRTWGLERVLRPGEQAITSKGDWVHASTDNLVVVNAQSRATISAGAYAFNRGGDVQAHAGSTTIAIGGTVEAYPGATVKVARSRVLVIPSTESLYRNR